MSIDQESLVVTLLRERVKLLAYIASIVRDGHLAEDIFQEVSVLAIRKSGEIRDGRHFLAWLRLTARHRALKAAKARGRYIPLDPALLDRLDEEWAQHDSIPSADLMEALRDCLEKLTPHARELVRLRYAQGLSGLHLAEAVDRNLNAVYVALSRIHRVLGRCIRSRAEMRGSRV